MAATSRVGSCSGGFCRSACSNQQHDQITITISLWFHGTSLYLDANLQLFLHFDQYSQWRTKESAIIGLHFPGCRVLPGEPGCRQGKAQIGSCPLDQTKSLASRNFTECGFNSSSPPIKTSSNTPHPGPMPSMDSAKSFGNHCPVCRLWISVLEISYHPG